MGEEQKLIEIEMVIKCKRIKRVKTFIPLIMKLPFNRKTEQPFLSPKKRTLVKLLPGSDPSEKQSKWHPLVVVLVGLNLDGDYILAIIQCLIIQSTSFGVEWIEFSNALKDYNVLRPCR